MFDQVFDTLRKASESTFQAQQDLFKKWVGQWPGVPSSPAAGVAGNEQFVKFQKKWLESVAEMVKKQRETLETQFAAGYHHLEEAFRLTEIKDPEELRTKTLALWQKTFECLKQAYENQIKEFQATAAKWAEMHVKGAA